jgi:CheY-like chemotaxis protein
LKPTDPSIPPRTIIVVDDSRAARKQVVFALQNEQGFAFVEAVDGRDGLAKLEENPDAALVICDVRLVAGDSFDDRGGAGAAEEGEGARRARLDRQAVQAGEPRRRGPPRAALSRAAAANVQTASSR